ncbi:MAG TPA: efflux RND transporter periplasmic adaptor subunit [Chloroflexota bacterium]|nr:efflux RND transporter periplasmic adaptor subunit [Chloroflexota bacterium]
MSTRRVLVAVQMMLREFTRRRLTQVLLVVVPPLMILSVYYDLPQSNIAIDVVENTVSFSTIVDQRTVTVAFITLFTISFLAAFFGFYLMLSAKQVDRRLVLCGYQPFEILAARSIILLTLCVLLTIYVLLILTPFFTPDNWPSFFGGMLLCALIYGLYGKIVGILIARELEGTWVVMVLPFLDTGYLEVPGFSSVLNAGWLKLMPGYFPSRITIDSAFTVVFDVGHDFVGGVVYAACFWLLAAGLFWYATRSYAGPKAERRDTMRRVALISAVAVAAIAASTYVAWPYLAPAGIQADGHVTAPEANVVSLVNGQVRSLEVAEGQSVEAGQELGVLQDFQTGQTQRLTAPISGAVTTLNVKRGVNVVAGETVAKVYDVAKLNVELDVEEVYIDRVALGDAVEIRASGLGQPLRGHVSKIGLVPVANQINLTSLTTNDTNQVKKYPVTVTLDQTTGGLQLDMRVRGVLTPRAR